jgi:protein-disulfide isomerase
MDFFETVLLPQFNYPGIGARWHLKIGIVLISLALCSCAPSCAVAQQAPQQAAQITLNRKIELMVRSRFEVPSNCEIAIGTRTASSVTGYDTLRVTVSQGDKSTEVDFLISNDNRTLAQLEKFDLDSNPALLIDTRNRPIRGNPNAPVTVVNFDDLECPVCAYVHQQLFSAALDRYGNEVRFVYKDNPLIEMHPWALHAAVDATCLADEGANAYWSYIDYVHAHIEEVNGETRDLPKSFLKLDQIASTQGASAGLNRQRLQACLKKQDEAPVRQSMREAAGLGLNFTPALFVNGEEIRGFTSFDDVWKVIDRALRESAGNPQGAQSNQQSK